MMSSSSDLATRRRLMFIGKEDFNFLAYNIVVLLDELKCTSEAKAFSDHRKLAFLIDLISTPENTEILDRHHRGRAPLGKQDLHALTTAYSKGVSRQPLTARVVHALIRRGLLNTDINENRKTTLFWLEKVAVEQDFIQSDLFALERANLRALRPICPKLRSVKFETFIERYFSDQGVRTWHS